MENLLFAISGPAGVGKGTLVKLLLQDDSTLNLSISCTTRPPRKGEIDGREYFFITKEQFLKEIDQNGFLEYDEHFGNYYGTRKAYVEKTLRRGSVILEIDVVGALNAKKIYSGRNRVVLIMIVPPDMQELKNRLIKRGAETEEQMKTRLDRVEYELSLGKEQYDYVVVNDDLQTAKRRLQEIIETERNGKGDKQ